MTQQRRDLHVANGTSTTRTIEAAGIPGDVSIWADPLYEGPVPAGLTDAQLTEVRARYLAGGTDTVAAEIEGLTGWRTVLERLESYDEVILWYEHDLFDQLNLLQLLDWLGGRPRAATPVTLVCIDSYPGHPWFKGLGELAPDELAALLPIRQAVTEAQYVLARRAWSAFREPTPESLDALRHANTAALPYLAAAIARFLQEYPWTNDGLSRTERCLMQLAGAGEIALSTAFPQMHEGEAAYYVTDLSLSAMADTLSRTSPSLLTVHDGGSGQPLDRSIALTPDGRTVLDGRQDRVSMCGIDRWLGGVHLHGRDNVWRWDDGRQAIKTP